MENQKKEGTGKYMYRMMTLKIGRLLNEERKARGLSVEQVAALVGLHCKYIKNAEFGGDKLNWITVGMLLRFYQKQMVVSLIDWEEELRGLMMTQSEYVRYSIKEQ